MPQLSIKNALILSAILVIVGKVTGFLRDLTMAIVYGADKATDAYFAANIIPSLSLTAFSSTIPLAFMPFYIRKLKELSEADANSYANTMLYVYLAITAMIMGMTIALAPWFIALIAPTFDQETTSLAIELVRLFSLSFLLTITCAYFSAIQYAHDIRLGQQVSPVINNTVFIVVVLMFGHLYDIRFAAIVAVSGWALQLPLQYYFARGKFHFERPRMASRADIGALMNLSAPVFVALFLEQGIVATAIYFAGAMKEGSVSIVTYANKLANLPLTLAIMLITIYIYPAMTRLAGDDDKTAFHTYLGRVTRLVMMLAVPAVIICWFEGETIARLAFGISKMSQEEVQSVGILFSIYMTGIFFLVLRDLANRYFYARTRGTGVMVVTAVFVVLNVVLCAIFVDQYGLKGIAMATALSAMIAFLLQFFLLRRMVGKMKPDVKFIALTVIGAGLMVLMFVISGQIFAAKGLSSGIITSTLAGLSYLALFHKGYGWSFMQQEPSA